MEIVNIIILFLLEILLLSIETQDLMEGSHGISILFLILRNF